MAPEDSDSSRAPSDALHGTERIATAQDDSEPRYRELFDSMSEGVCIIEVMFDDADRPFDYRFLETNRAFTEQTGIRDAVGRTMLEIAPNMEPRWFEFYGQIARTGEPMRIMDEAKELERWFKVSAYRVGGPESHRIAVLFSDCTETQRTEKALLASEERMRLAVDGALMGTWDWNLETDELVWSERNEQLLGYPPGRALYAYNDFQSRLHPEDATRLQSSIDACRQDGTDLRCEFRVIWPDGSIHWLSAFGRLQPRVGTQSVRMVGNLVEITERKRVEELTAVSELRYRRLFQSAKDGILILNTHDARIVDANPFMTEMLGFSHADFLGKELWEIGLFRDRAANQAALRELREKNYVRYENLPLKSSLGRPVDVEIVANVYQEGQQSVIQCNIRDITIRASMERQMHDHAVVVEDMHRRKDEFLAMLSHELRSPLAPIMNAVQTLGLQRERVDPLQQRALDIIARQVGQLQHLVDDLLEVSRITSGRLHLRKKSLQVAEVVSSAVETARPLIEAHHHELTVTVAAAPIWVDADAARLEQVLVNLLTNAVKFTHDGGHLWLTVEMDSRRPTAEPQVLIRIRDNGVGIAPALVPDIFELFSQSDRSLDRAQGGLGIGLALVQRLTELHGGTVEVNTRLGEGSEFVVCLPTIVPVEEPAPVMSPPVARLSGRPLRVLVVDDNPDTVASFTLLVEALGHVVRSAHDGPSAIQAAMEFHPDVALLDIGLPGLNGYQVAERIRADPELAKTMLIALTGYGQVSDRQASQDAGFNQHLVKPARLDQLRQIFAAAAEVVGAAGDEVLGARRSGTQA